METIVILINQLLMMALFMAVGYVLFKKKLVSVVGSRDLSSILLYVVLPCVIIKSYAVGFSTEMLEGLAVSFALALITLLVSILISSLFFKKKNSILNFGVAFSNAGFIGIPLVSSLLGGDAVFYVSSFVAILFILQWTYGVFIMTGAKDSIKLKKILLNPVLISMIIGLALFLGNIQLPIALSSAIGAISSMNAPIAMIILGAFLAQTEILSIFKDKMLYFSSFVRLFLIPAVTLALLFFVPKEFYVIKMCVLIAAIAPIGSNVAVFAQINELDYSYAVKSICLSTILSLFSMPIFIAIAVSIF